MIRVHQKPANIVLQFVLEKIKQTERQIISLHKKGMNNRVSPLESSMRSDSKLQINLPEYSAAATSSKRNRQPSMTLSTTSSAVATGPDTETSSSATTSSQSVPDDNSGAGPPPPPPDAPPPPDYTPPTRPTIIFTKSKNRGQSEKTGTAGRSSSGSGGGSGGGGPLISMDVLQKVKLKPTSFKKKTIKANPNNATLRNCISLLQRRLQERRKSLVTMKDADWNENEKKNTIKK